MGFWAEYKKALRPREVEEPIDIWAHRPVGFVIARAAYPTPITPDQITIVSLLFGVAGGVCFGVTFPHHLPIGFALLFFSAALDCADGMLARARKTSSPFGRMLDGLCDFTAMGSGGIGALIYLISMYPGLWQAGVCVGLTALTVWTSSFHTMCHEHLKSVYMRTVYGTNEGEGWRAAEARKAEAKQRGMSLFERFNWAAYDSYLAQMKSVMPKIDPLVEIDLDRIAFSQEAAAIYKRHHLRPMTTASNWFGFGMLIFPLAAFTGFGRPDLFLVYRFGFLNLLFWLYFVPMQRRASRAAKAELDALREGARTAEVA